MRLKTSIIRVICVLLYNAGVGRNKAFRAQARISVSGTLYESAGNATTRYALRQAQDRLGWSYSGLRLMLVITEFPEIKN